MEVLLDDDHGDMELCLTLHGLGLGVCWTTAGDMLAQVSEITLRALDALAERKMADWLVARAFRDFEPVMCPYVE